MLARHGYGVIGACERFDVLLRIRFAQSTAVFIERSVARTRFSASFLIRESIMRGYDAALIDLPRRIRQRVAAGEQHVRRDLYGRRTFGAPSSYGPDELDPWTLLGDTPWSLAPRPVQVNTRLTRSLDRALYVRAYELNVPKAVFLLHTLALGWSVTCNEIQLLLRAGFRPAYLFPGVIGPGRRSRAPWRGPRRQPLYGLSWLRRPGADLSYVDPPLTEPDPRDPFLAEL